MYNLTPMTLLHKVLHKTFPLNTIWWSWWLWWLQLTFLFLQIILFHQHSKSPDIQFNIIYDREKQKILTLKMKPANDLMQSDWNDSSIH